MATLATPRSNRVLLLAVRGSKKQDSRIYSGTTSATSLLNHPCVAVIDDQVLNARPTWIRSDTLTDDFKEDIGCNYGGLNNTYVYLEKPLDDAPGDGTDMVPKRIGKIVDVEAANVSAQKIVQASYFRLLNERFTLLNIKCTHETLLCSYVTCRTRELSPRYALLWSSSSCRPPARTNARRWPSASRSKPRPLTRCQAHILQRASMMSKC